MQGVMDHIVLNADAGEGLERFDAEVVELEAERVEEFRGGKVPFPSVGVSAGTVIDVAPPAMWERTRLQARGRPNLNHFCLTLEKSDWDKLRERLAARQVAIEGPLPRWGARGQGTS